MHCELLNTLLASCSAALAGIERPVPPPEPKPKYGPPHVVLWLLLCCTLTLNGSVMETPSEITVNEYGVICDHKGRYARLVSIVPEP